MRSSTILSLELSTMESTTASPTTNPVPGFDPFLQAVTLLLPDGTPFNITMPEINTYASFGVQICMNFGSQLGASFITLVILLLLTKRENRRSPIFILTGLSLALSVIRSALQAVYFMGPFYNPYAYFAQDYTRVPRSAYHISLTAGAMTLLLQLSIELSLILQVHVVLVTASKVHRFWIMVATITIALLAIGMRFALTVINGLAVRAARNFSGYEWLASATTITTTISIFFFCVVFVAKLGLALWQRRKLGLRQFGPMQIIFIMGCQTLIVPGKPPSFPTCIFTVLTASKLCSPYSSILFSPPNSAQYSLHLSPSSFPCRPSGRPPASTAVLKPREVPTLTT